MRNLKLFILVILTAGFLQLTPGCAGARLHPGAVNTFDSTTATTLDAIRITIDKARPQVENNGPLANLKPALNRLISAYDAAIGPYKAWHDAAKVTPSTSSTQVQALLAAATKALSEWFAQPAVK